MFDIGFLELVVVGIIALIVLGPERLPGAARSLGMWVGKAKQGFNTIKQEIDRELKMQEIQQQLAEQKAKLEQQIQLESLQQLKQDSDSALETLTRQVNEPAEQIQAELRRDNTSLEKDH